MTDRQWSEWKAHKAGDPCPIPNAKACEYEMKTAATTVHPRLLGAADFNEDFLSGEITHYRFLMPPLTARESGLLEALRDVTDALEGFVNTEAKLRTPYEHPLSAYDRARAAISKATGEHQ